MKYHHGCEHLSRCYDDNGHTDGCIWPDLDDGPDPNAGDPQDELADIGYYDPPGDELTVARTINQEDR